MTTDGIVGRIAELALLDGQLEALQRRTTPVLALAGEPGIGKTRLLTALCERADERDCLVLEGRAAELERDLPFGLFVDALDDYVDALGREPLRPLQGRLADLGGILPCLADEGPAPLQAERHRSHHALRSLLELLAARMPVVLALDDLHWADEASLELLAYLLRRRPRGPVLIALGFRPHQAAPELVAALEVAARDGGFQRVELGPLSRAEADELLGQAAHELYRESGGNPFYLEQLARSEARAGPGADVPGVGEVPREVASALRGELGQLSERARSLAEGAAVAGDPLDFELGAVAAGIGDGEALEALDELVERGLLRATSVPRRFRFRHPIVRRAVYEGAPPGRRLLAHARLADHLEASGSAPVNWAHHVERSAQADDERAIAVLTEAGRAAEATAPGSAARWFGAALRLLPPGDGARRLELLIPLATALGSAGHLDESRAALLEALDQLPADAWSERARLTAFCAAVEQLLGRRRDAQERLTRTLRALPGRPGPEACELQIELAVDAFWKSDFEGASRQAGAAFDLARELAAPDLTALAAAVGAFSDYCTGRLADAETHRAASAALVEAMSDAELSERLDAPYNLGWAEYFLGYSAEAIDHLERGMRVARATGRGQFIVPMMVAQAWALGQRGRLGDAVEAAQTAVDAARLTSPQLLSWALMGHCWAVLPTGDLPAAMASGEESVAIAASLEPSVLTRAAHAHFAAVCLEAGDVDRCREQMAAAGAPDFPLIEPGRRCLWYEVLTRAELREGRTDAAAAWAARGEAVREAAPPVAALSADRAVALVRLACGDTSGAARAAASAVGACDGLPLQLGRSLIVAGRALATSGDTAAAIGELERAERELAALGAWHYRDEAARELRRLGRQVSRPARRGSGEGVEALSERERQIAELVAAGHTNRQIADQLFLSTRTVERHLSHVFHKLDVSSRAQVGARLSRG
jgi:DNA-binding CsgD family transcriptional regulator/tetratricopeptide (TPR) repeat protein